MGLFRKKPDPIADREKQLKQQIAAIEGQIKHLSSRIVEEKMPPPNSRAVAGSSLAAATSAAPKEPIFETVDDQRLRAPTEPPAPLGLYNERGMRKYDPSGWWRRVAGLFRAPPPSNPKLVNYLAAGSIQGLRPLRYEKRVARNHLIFWVVLLILVLWGILAALYRNR